MHFNKTSLFLFIVCLIAISATSTSARVWHVPGDAPILSEVLDMVESGDVIELCCTRHKIVGRNYVIPAGITIRSGFGMPGTCLFVECPCEPGDWRNQPVFVVEEAGLPVIFEGITFEGFTLTEGVEYVHNPIIHVTGGTLHLVDCIVRDFYKNAFYFEGGSGVITGTEFSTGRGCPSSVYFEGESLLIEDCVFRENTWIQDCGEFRGNVINLQSGLTTMNRCVFVDNGPLWHVMAVGADATVLANEVDFADNAAVYEGCIQGGIVDFICCEIDLNMWEIDPGSVVTVNNDDCGTVVVEAHSWTGVKSLFR